MSDLRTLPELALTVDGTALQGIVARTVTSVNVRAALGSPTLAEIALVEPPRQAGDILVAGRRVRIATNSDLLFEGRIATLSREHGTDQRHVLRVVAYDDLHALRLRRHTRALAEVSAGALVHLLAADIGAECQVPRETPTRSLVLQHYQSDFDLAADLAADSGLYLVLRDGVLRLVGLDGEGEANSLQLGGGLHSVAIETAAWRKPEAIAISAWDLASCDVVATNVRPDLPREEFRQASTTPAERAATWPMANRLVDRDAEARQLARSRLAEVGCGAALARGIASGSPHLMPGQRIALLGRSGEAMGDYVLTQTLHRVDAVDGYRTHWSTEAPERQRRPLTPIFTLGVVVDTADPHRLGRARVSLPLFGDVATGWLQIVSPGAGARKGLATFPETGDRVLIVAPDGDPARCLVLGGLFADEKPPLPTGATEPRPFVLQTRAGQRLELSGSEAAARLLTSAGSCLEMLPGASQLSSAGDLIIEAPGRKITIRAAAIDFERG